MERSISRVALPFSCMSTRCDVPPTDSNSVMGVPARLPVRAVVHVGNQLVVAPSDGNEVFEWRNNAFVEVRAMGLQFRTFGIAADGSLLLFTTTDPAALNRLSSWSAPRNGTTFMGQGAVGSVAMTADAVVNFEDLGPGGQVVTGINQAGEVFRLHRTGANAWVSVPPNPILPGNVTRLSAASIWDGSVLRTAYALEGLAGPSLEVEGAPSYNPSQGATDLEVMTYGNGSLAFAVSEAGLIRLGIFERSTGQLRQVFPSTNTAEGWNGTTANASRPRLTLIDGSIGLSWQEGAASSYTMAGRIIR
jgi:hypothetical protein